MQQKNTSVERHTIAVLVDNEAGVLARVIGLFSGRGYNIESLTVAEVDANAHTSRVTIVTSGTPQVIEQIEGATAGASSPVHRVTNWTTRQARHRARDGAGQGGGHRRATGGSPCACLTSFARPRSRHHPYELRLRNHRRAGKERRLPRTDAAFGFGGRFPHRRCGNLAWPRGDVMGHLIIVRSYRSIIHGDRRLSA